MRMHTQMQPSPKGAKTVVAVALAAMLVAWSTSASAQRANFSLDRLEIGGSPNDGFAVWRPRMNEKTVFFGQMAVGYSLHPLKGDTVAATGQRNLGEVPNAVDHQLTTYLTAGVELMDRVGVAVTLPVVAYQSGGNPCDRSNISSCQSVDVSPTVPSDTRIDVRTLLYRSDDRKFHLGLAGSLYVASGNNLSFTTDEDYHGALRVMSEVDLTKVIFTANVGPHFKPARRLNSFAVTDELQFAAGVFFPLRDGKVRVGGQIFGSTGMGSTPNASGADVSTTFSKKNTPLEWLGELRFALDERKASWAAVGAGTRLSPGYGATDLRVVASIGYSFGISDSTPQSPGRRFRTEKTKEPKSIDTDNDGYPDDIDQCPTVPEDNAPPHPADGCPGPADRDHDGILDDADKCPDQPEDKDGIEDLDGCPEDDFDSDGVPDANDACPREPGRPAPDPKQNGCPEFIRRIEGSTEIQILKKVEFATGSANLLPSSFPILDEVVKLLVANKDIVRVSVEGHTDNKGKRDMNVRLSQARAESVMKYLAAHGIDAARLEAHGYGPDKPLDSNDTNDGRQRNRRVEFHIQDQDK